MNEVTIFMLYMFNMWSERECKRLFGEDLGDHIWSKYLDQRDKLKFYADIDDKCRQKLVDRANEAYGKHR